MVTFSGPYTVDFNEPDASERKVEAERNTDYGYWHRKAADALEWQGSGWPSPGANRETSSNLIEAALDSRQGQQRLAITKRLTGSVSIRSYPPNRQLDRIGKPSNHGPSA
jgi:hypothetical protein